MWNVASRAGLVVALLFGCPPDAAAAEGRWPAVYVSPPIFFYSTDMSSISLIIRHSRDPLPPVELKIPRAFVVFADKYETRRYSQLPAIVDTSSASIAMTYPDGKPLSVRGREEAAARRISEAEALLSLRMDRYEATLHYNAPHIPDDTWMRNPGLVKPSGSYDGLERLVGAARDVYLGQIGVDEFARIDCTSIAQAKPLYFCKAHVRLRADLSAEIDFVDFRFSGGRSFANERLRVFRNTICQFIVSGCRRAAD